MPRKRGTRAQTTRAKPKLNAFDDEDNAHGMSQAEKIRKLETIVADFNYNMENVRKGYQDEQKAGVNEINRRFHQMRCKLSPAELKMTVQEYIDQQQQLKSEEEDTVDALPVRSTLLVPTARSSTVTQALNKYKSRQMIDPIPEEGSGSDTARPKGKGKRATKGKKATMNTGPPNSFVTPAVSRTASEMGWGATPLVTPKFDPRLPVTPADRRSLRPGEVALSLAGSPITRENNRKTQCILAGEELQIPDNVTDIQGLMDTLKSIMEKHNQSN